ncbi:MAG: hypothetical protein ACOYJD_06305 [Christensenellales bacterium]|jgi:hypothetical protein
MKRNRSLKKIGAVLAAVMILFGMVSTVYAADASVSYHGHSAGMIFSFAPDDLFDNFKGMMPGDVRDQNIIVSNDSENKIIVFLRGEPFDESVEGLLSKATISVKNSAGETVAEEETADKIWPANGTDRYFELGEIEPGAEETLVATIKIPVELGNEFQNAIGKVQWIFMVQEEELIDLPTPTPPYGEVTPTPTPPTDPPSSVTPTPTVSPGSTPKTGDDTQIWLWVAVMAALVPVLILLIVKGRKRPSK